MLSVPSMLVDNWLKLTFLSCLFLSWRVNALFFGALGGGCGCGCCGPPPCCGVSLPSISTGCCQMTGSGCGGCMDSSSSGQSSCGSGGYSFGSMGSYSPGSYSTASYSPGSYSPGSYSQGSYSPGGGCSQSQSLLPFSNPRPIPSGYAVPPSPQSVVSPTFSPQLPQIVYSIAPTDNLPGGSPSYGPFNGNHPPSSSAPLPFAPPPPPTSASYQEHVDLGDNIDKPKTGNEVTGVDDITDKTIKSTSSTGDYDDAVLDIDDLGDVTSNRSGMNKKNNAMTADYSDNSLKSKVSGIPNDLVNAADQDTTGDPKCSSETLRVIMQENIVTSPTISKQLIFSAGRLAFGQTIDVICSRNKFSYTVVSSKIFCEASRGRITCFAFLQP